MKNVDDGTLPVTARLGRRRRTTGFLVSALLVAAAPAAAQGGASGACVDQGGVPAPESVPVTTVPVVVPSTTADYFVLYARHEIAGGARELPVAVVRGQAGSTTLRENVRALPPERYRVERRQVARPADVDGDCIDDLADPNPVNAAPVIDPVDGAVTMADMDDFNALAFKHPQTGNSYLKLMLFDWETDRPGVYFQNAGTHPGHFTFAAHLGFGLDEVVAFELDYDPNLVAPDGTRGLYYFYWSLIQDGRFAELVPWFYTLLAASMPLIEDDLAFYVPNSLLPHVQSWLPAWRSSRVHLLFEDDLASDDLDFVALNEGVGVGLLRELAPEERPHPHDIGLYETLPNELPRLAGIISTAPQTPLSHVNLRAIQNGIPNAFIPGALDDPEIVSLLDGYVRYTVTANGWSLRSATVEEVRDHYADSRPAEPQTPQRNLSVREITPLDRVGFTDGDAFGVKAANVAVLGKLGFPPGTTPSGFAVPFRFYDEFMKANGLYEDVREMLASEGFAADFARQEDALKKLRKKIRDAKSPPWIVDALTSMHAAWPEGQSLRYRSSTNNEDLPGFHGAGLYDSKTQRADETIEDGIDKSLKQVFASMWNFRAFSEREFHRIDHMAAAMGVLVHPNYDDELANGVAVSFDPFFGRDTHYYVNTQVGEDLVTNPEAHSAPEELLLSKTGVGDDLYSVLAFSNLAPPGQLLMSDSQMDQLRRHLSTIHSHFESLYEPAPDEPFAMEIEFKITSDNVLAIKQARPWVFGDVHDGEELPFAVSVDCPAAPCRVSTGETVRFSNPAPADGPAQRWDFGDGGARRGAEVEYAWIEPGFHEVTLTVAGDTVGAVPFLVEATEPDGACVADDVTRCLLNSRYAVTVDWETEDGEQGRGRVVPAGTNDSGLFRFFGPANWEVLVKVLDGCGENGRVWVFAASTTDLGFTIRVADTAPGASEPPREYRNAAGAAANSITDSYAFADACRE